MGTGYVVNGYEVRNPHTLAVYFRWQDTRRDGVGTAEIPLGDGSESETESEIVKECEMPVGVKVDLSEADKVAIGEMYTAGEHIKAVARHFAISNKRVTDVLLERGVVLRGRGGRKSKAAKTDKARMVLETQELDVQAVNGVQVRPPMGHRDMPREYVPPAIVRTGQLRAVEPVSLLQPELVGDGRDVLAQLGRLNNLIRELRSIEGVVVQGSVSIALNVEAQI